MRSLNRFAFTLAIFCLGIGVFAWRAASPPLLRAADDNDATGVSSGVAGSARDLAEGKTAEPNSEGPPFVKLTPEQMTHANVTVAQAGPGRLNLSIDLPGEVCLNADRTARVTPRVSGIVVQVLKNLGDKVRAGESMALIESKDLAVAKAALFASREREALMEATHAREKTLWEKKISAEQDYLAAKQAWAEARIETRSAEQQLRALGLTSEELRKLSGSESDDYARYVVTAPLDGTVIEKHVVLGDSLQADAAAFVVADLSTVWVDFSVSANDIPSVSIGQAVQVFVDDLSRRENGTISYVGPTVEQGTRAELARVVLNNESGAWKPGMFVRGKVEYSSTEVKILISRSAIETVNGKPSVFVQTPEGFQASPVTAGRGSEEDAEILSGLQPGQSYAVSGTFILKAELEKGKGGEE
jgi:cobalt-zinc-cadmium efflux system membrane fusion protein